MAASWVTRNGIRCSLVELCGLASEHEKITLVKRCPSLPTCMCAWRRHTSRTCELYDNVKQRKRTAMKPRNSECRSTLGVRGGGPPRSDPPGRWNVPADVHDLMKFGPRPPLYP
eukprot:6082540-Amphidinium_carterae.2